MSTNISSDAAYNTQLWVEEELRSCLIVVQTIFEVLMFSAFDRQRVLTIADEQRHSRGHEYTAFLWESDEDSELINGDPTPPGHSHQWTQLVMTNKCDFFAELMEDVVRCWVKGTKSWTKNTIHTKIW